MIRVRTELQLKQCNTFLTQRLKPFHAQNFNADRGPYQERQ